MKRQPTLAQQIKKELKATFPELKVRCVGGHDPHVYLLNLHSTNYSYDQINDFCSQYRRIQYCEVTGETLLGGRYVPVKNDITEDFKAQLRDMFIAYHNNHVDKESHLTVGQWFCYADLCHEEYDEWQQLLNNECYCNLSDKPEETKEVNPVISPEPEVIEEEAETNSIPTQQEIKNEITLIEVEIEKLTELIDYLDNNDISGNIYDTTQEQLDGLCQQLNELRMKLDPTVEIKAQIEANRQELKKLSVRLTQAISELDTLKVSQIQQEITNTVKEIEILQDKLNGNSIVRLFG